ncbi:MAG: hypothetical protein VX638_04385 [Chloroflexota bacterium]|nr:hypothetical protein [Chloroflexota bacterium]
MTQRWISWRIKVRSKDLEEGKPADYGADDPEEKPRVRIDLTFVQDTNSVNIGLMVAIAAPIGAVALGVIMGIGFLESFDAVAGLNPGLHSNRILKGCWRFVSGPSCVY